MDSFNVSIALMNITDGTIAKKLEYSVDK